MAKITLQRLESLDVLAFPSNALVDYYDVVHKYMDALCHEKGMKFFGEGAHKELIDFFFEEALLNEAEISFVQQLRTLRNRIQYEGFFIDKNYLERNTTKIQKIIEKLEGITDA